MKKYECLNCKKIFESYKGQKGRIPKYCSHLCYGNRKLDEAQLKHLEYARSLKKPSAAKIKPKLIRYKPKHICINCGKTFTKIGAYRKWTPKYCTQECWSKRKVSEPTRKKQSISKLGKKPWNKGIAMWMNRKHPRGTLGKKIPSRSGANSIWWKGGITPINMAIRRSSQYNEWRKKVFERDKFTCQFCNKIGGKLNADHILPFSTHPQSRFDIENGRTLCVPCHRKTDTYGSKSIRRT